ncbi:hypothetical protein GT204_30580 [Streptomyces sp. SID4919]|uniref:hypothetical protein n=1 Tax=unclassified Streptomyces TaxID=2593676 RepID=UPI001183F37B|nr:MULTISPECIES: hypothetical protein [unclassified Streptomyces]MYY13111.1 hypothetical protein [Streptomyces sp. SID4919]
MAWRAVTVGSWVCGTGAARLLLGLALTGQVVLLPVAAAALPGRPSTAPGAHSPAPPRPAQPFQPVSAGHPSGTPGPPRGTAPVHPAPTATGRPPSGTSPPGHPPTGPAPVTPVPVTPVPVAPVPAVPAPAPPGIRIEVPWPGESRAGSKPGEGRPRPGRPERRTGPRESAEASTSPSPRTSRPPHVPREPLPDRPGRPLPMWTPDTAPEPDTQDDEAAVPGTVDHAADDVPPAPSRSYGTPLGILPLGTGLVLVGLGLGYMGWRLRAL